MKQPNGTLYVGVTSDIVRRVHQHRIGQESDFVEEYDVTRLVHLERFDDIEDAIRREKQLKNWKWNWKLDLYQILLQTSGIRSANPVSALGEPRKRKPDSRTDQPDLVLIRDHNPTWDDLYDEACRVHGTEKRR